MCKACAPAAHTTRQALPPIPLTVLTPIREQAELSGSPRGHTALSRQPNPQPSSYLALAESGAVVDFVASRALVRRLSTTVDTGLL